MVVVDVRLDQPCSTCSTQHHQRQRQLPWQWRKARCGPRKAATTGTGWAQKTRDARAPTCGAEEDEVGPQHGFDQRQRDGRRLVNHQQLRLRQLGVVLRLDVLQWQGGRMRTGDNTERGGGGAVNWAGQEVLQPGWGAEQEQQFGRTRVRAASSGGAGGNALVVQADPQLPPSQTHLHRLAMVAEHIDAHHRLAKGGVGALNQVVVDVLLQGAET